MATMVEYKALAKDLGITGYSKMNKAEITKAIDDAYAAMDGRKVMSPDKRIAAYSAQRNNGPLSARQMRRVRKAENKAKR